VMLNGVAVKSCTILAVQADGARCWPLRAWGQRISCTPYRKVWEEHGLQCGFCTPGMIMAAHQLLQRNPNPSEAEIRWGLRAICVAAPAISTS
jgi:carbon-monoxide dehydrogenase small subunit